MKSWSLLKKSFAALSFQAMAMASTPAHATVYMFDFLGTTTGLNGPVGTIGNAAVGDRVDLLLSFDDTTPGAQIAPSFVFSGTGFPAALTATLTIGGQVYQNAGNAFSYYANDANDIEGGLQNQDRATGVIDSIGFGILNTTGLKDANITQTGSWYFPGGGYSDFERETGVTFTGVNPDYTIASIDFMLKYLTVYKQGDPVPPLAAGPMPEPSTWAMMLCGLGLVGAVMRRGKHLAHA